MAKQSGKRRCFPQALDQARSSSIRSRSTFLLGRELGCCFTPRVRVISVRYCLAAHLSLCRTRSSFSEPSETAQVALPAKGAADLEEEAVVEVRLACRRLAEAKVRRALFNTDPLLKLGADWEG